MVLSKLGLSICDAIQELIDAAVVDDKALADFFAGISAALSAAGVETSIVADVKVKIGKPINLDNLANRSEVRDKREIIYRAVFDELCRIFHSGPKPPCVPEKGKTSFVFFAGREESGKTMAFLKYAYYHQKKGWKPAIVCADKYSVQNVALLQQIASKEGEIPIHCPSTYEKSDAIKNAAEGVKKFVTGNHHDLIIVDVCMDDLPQYSLDPIQNLLIWVTNSTVGRAIKIRADFHGGVILTRMNNHPLEGGCLSKLASAKCPVLFIDTGEKMDEFEAYDVKALVNSVLGNGYWSGFMREFEKFVPKDEQLKHFQKVRDEGKFTLRTMQDQFLTIRKFMSITGRLLKHPAFQFRMKPTEEAGSEPEKITSYLEMMKVMSSQELDSSDPIKWINEDRIKEIANGSGYEVVDVKKMLEQHNHMANLWREMEGRRKQED
ncbi:OLC1v1013856C1 [Oldenlandia corymbosa var. corymbosa]|uniref:OLC1v1013856C1 n=1 Tax=Oldenlandia corymbosa var. corymbosa TaxID=529605 RepID=A0AAV1E2W9_OLDCO|nr:OLC1v1013856C1 [Oldenlandia corymbosa var. corymbosa]